MTSALTCWATTGSPLCSQASRADRCASAVGPATTRALRGKPLVPFLVGALADHGQIRARDVERADQPVNVPAERPPVGWHVGRIN